MGMWDWWEDEESGVESIKMPEYYEDPDYRETQDYLKKYGMDIMSGQIPDYYKPIGETGSKEFEDMLGLTTRDIQKSASEAMALQGRGRGGALPAVTASAIADASTKARYGDYTRSLEGKGFLFNQGRGITEGVRGAGQTEGARKNQFNLSIVDKQMEQQSYLDKYEAQQDAELGDLIGTIASAGIGAYTGGLSGVAGGVLAGAGDALFGTDFINTLLKSSTGKKASSGVSDLGSIDEYKHLSGDESDTLSLFS
jgi:hypothetical protein